MIENCLITFFLKKKELHIQLCYKLKFPYGVLNNYNLITFSEMDSIDSLFVCISTIIVLKFISFTRKALLIFHRIKVEKPLNV